MNALRLPAVCQSCGGSGPLVSGSVAQPVWCSCSGKAKGGPYNAPPGHVTVFIYESKEDAAFREEGRLLGNAFIRAKDDLSSRFVRCGRGYRELPRGNPKREQLERAYAKALRAQAAHQRRCSHPSRSLFNRAFCDVCHAYVECDVAHFRLLAREVGKRAAMRLAV
jgi:hypothetical protein